MMLKVLNELQKNISLLIPNNSERTFSLECRLSDREPYNLIVSLDIPNLCRGRIAEIGWSDATHIGSKHCYISRVFTIDCLRNKGVMHLMLDAYAIIMAEYGFEDMILTVSAYDNETDLNPRLANLLGINLSGELCSNNSAIAFYEKCGFKVIGEYCNCPVMVRKLSPR